MNDLQTGKTDHTGAWAIGTMLVLVLIAGACNDRPKAEYGSPDYYYRYEMIQP